MKHVVLPNEELLLFFFLTEFCLRGELLRVCTSLGTKENRFIEIIPRWFASRLSGASLVNCESRRVREKLQTLVRRWLKQNVITLTVRCLGE
ncbi:hypothetical protein R1flu_021859 [Riccia fluitans]|uniref:Secreted protein n=1 Tax=Riccia fluitans TaxID=41844 RepID=A0ABD1ZQK3_9MARC